MLFFFSIPDISFKTLKNKANEEENLKIQLESENSEKKLIQIHNEDLKKELSRKTEEIENFNCKILEFENELRKREIITEDLRDESKEVIKENTKILEANKILESELRDWKEKLAEAKHGSESDLKCLRDEITSLQDERKFSEKRLHEMNSWM